MKLDSTVTTLPPLLTLDYILEKGEKFLKAKNQELTNYNSFLEVSYECQVEDKAQRSQEKFKAFADEKFKAFAQNQVKDIKTLQNSVMEALQINIESKNDLLSEQTKKLLKIAQNILWTLDKLNSTI